MFSSSLSILFFLFSFLSSSSCVSGKDAVIIRGSVNNSNNENTFNLVKQYLPPDFSYYDVGIFNNLSILINY